VHNAFARQVRLGRLARNEGGRLFVVPLDHAVSDGPIISPASGLDHLVGQLATNRVDAVVLHKGMLRHVDHRWFTTTSLIVHLSASTMHAADPDAKYLVATVPEALRLGADAVSVHVNLGSRDEARQIADLGAVAEECDRWNVPLMAMIYPRGPRIDNPKDPGLIAHAATVAAQLGADVVKTPYVGSAGEMSDVVRSCPIPIIVAGGPRFLGAAGLMSYVDDALATGVAGLAMGRNIFQAPDPGAVAGQVADRVHRRAEESAPHLEERLAPATV
jgi:2-amino-4,5-dihydroxy-6-oxo-7-(phosphonooxy)heptanoate synthase